MNVELTFPWTAEELQAAKLEAEKHNPLPLRALCRKEVERFEQVIREHPDYQDGLVLIERRVVEGYLYQKIRGHIDAPTGSPQSPKEP